MEPRFDLSQDVPQQQQPQQAPPQQAPPPPLPQPWAATPTQPALGQQPWAQDAPLAARLPIAHPWAASPYAYAVPLLPLPGRIRGSVSDYREGWVCMAPEGLLFSGKVVLPLWQRTTLMLIGALFCVGALLASFLVENALLRPRMDSLSWDCIEEVVLNSKKGRMCLVYHLADAPEKPISLGLQLAPPPLFHQFAQVATHYLGPEKVHEGKIGPPTTPAQTAAAIGILVVIFAAIGFMVWLGSK